jgi:hypothetical protein
MNLGFPDLAGKTECTTQPIGVNFNDSMKELYDQV